MQLLQAKSCFFLAALVFGAAKSLIGIGQFTLPLSFKKPPISPIVTMHTFCSGGILALDVHPTKRNLVLCGSMDHQTFILDLSKTDDDLLLQRFKVHTKYVVRVLWSMSGTFFVSASYDKTVCVYRLHDDDSDLYDHVQTLTFNGAVETVAFSKNADTFVVGVRDDYLLHCYTLSTGTAELCREINMNALGDDYVSFVPRHISFSPDGQFILISTGKSMTMQVYLHLQVYTCT
jgi:WD40 repeat protein